MYNRVFRCNTYSGSYGRAQIRWPSLDVFCVACMIAPCVFVQNAYAQYGFDTWTTSQGLPQNIIHTLRQTRDGYIWLTTSNGLVRFDGLHFTVFDRMNTPGIQTNRLAALFESADGDLCVGSESGGLLRYAQHRFTTYTTADGLPHQYVRGITGDGAGPVWVLSNGHIVRYDNGRFRPADLGGVTARFEPSAWNTEIFWGIGGGVLYRFTQGGLSTRPLPRMLHRLRTREFAEDSSGTLWIKTADERIIRVDAEGGTVSRPASGPALVLSDRDRAGQLWNMRVGRDLERYLRVPDRGHDVEIPFRISYEDRENNLWLTSNHGL